MIDKSNLSRQTAYTTDDVGKSKAETLALRLEKFIYLLSFVLNLNRMNSNIDIKAECIRFTQNNFDYFLTKF